MNDGWVTPTLYKDDDGRVYEISSTTWEGPEVVCVAADRCLTAHPSGGPVKCHLVRHHHGPHWAVADSIGDQLSGALAIVTGPPW